MFRRDASLAKLSGLAMFLLGLVTQNAAPSVDPTDLYYCRDGLQICCDPSQEAVSGHGRTTAGYITDGTLTQLRWPSPSYDDHLDYRIELTHEKASVTPRKGARDNQGAADGILYSKGGRLFRDPSYFIVATTGYLNDDTDVFRTRYESDQKQGPSHSAECVWFVEPDLDVLVRRCNITRADNPPGGWGYIFYMNPALMSRDMHNCSVDKKNCFPAYDWSSLVGSIEDKDAVHGFSLVFDDDTGVFTSALPSEPSIHKSEYNEQVQMLNNKTLQPQDWAKIVDYTWKPRVAMAVGSSIKFERFYCGADKSYGAYPGFDDAYDVMTNSIPDLQSSQWSRASPGHENFFGAIILNETNAKSKGEWEVSVYIGLGSNIAEAQQKVQLAKNYPGGAKAMQANAENADLYFLSKCIHSPASKMTSEQQDTYMPMFKRSLLTVKSAQTLATGSLVAGTSMTRWHNFEWPRDTSFPHYLLTVCGGYAKEVMAHGRFLASIQRKFDFQDYQPGGVLHNDSLNFSPAGSYAMCYFGDGCATGPVNFEIDETGFALWSMCMHIPHISPEYAFPYWSEIKESVFRAANLLTVRCRDPSNDLQCLSSEDDTPFYTQGGEGASTVLLGLMAAAEAGRLMREPLEVWWPWYQRALELATAIKKHFFEPSFFNATQFMKPVLPYTVWPLPLVSPLNESDPNIQQMWKHVVKTGVDLLQARVVAPKPEMNAGYDANYIIPLLMFLPKDSKERQVVEKAMNVSILEVPRFNHLGEFYVYNGPNPEGKPLWSNRIAVPQVWAGSLQALSIYANFYPGALVFPPQPTET